MQDLDKLITNTINNNSLIKINDQIYLTNYQIDILNRYHIPYETCSSIKDIIYLIEDYLEEDYGEELDEVASSLDEFSYYNFTNK